jgi:hypothetical protein
MGEWYIANKKPALDVNTLKYVWISSNESIIIKGQLARKQNRQIFLEDTPM